MHIAIVRFRTNGNDKTAIGRLRDRIRFFIPRPAQAFLPLKISGCAQFHNPCIFTEAVVMPNDIAIRGGGITAEGKTTIGSLDDTIGPVIARAAEALLPLDRGRRDVGLRKGWDGNKRKDKQKRRQKSPQLQTQLVQHRIRAHDQERTATVGIKSPAMAWKK